jgi:diguanylate cyclase (GGDEF)-like protein
MSLKITDLPPERRPRILLIEDSQVDRRMLCHGLGGQGLDVVEAADGLMGVDTCRTDPPDLVLLDLGLPFCDGFEILNRLKSDRRTHGIPVIVVSATSETTEKARGLDMGAVDFVTKPYDLIELLARIRAALRTKRFQELLERRAHVDSLTGLANRAALEERLTSEWSLHRRHGAGLAVVMLDLDLFKKVNDDYGHAIGDEVLRSAAAALRASVRTSDMVARYGGEEFVIIAPHCDTAVAVVTTERFRRLFSASPLPMIKEGLRVTSSAGVASVPDDEVGSAAELLSWADRALYEAKALGRDRVISRAALADHVLEGNPSFNGSGSGLARLGA